MRKKAIQIRDWADDHLRRLCGGMSPGRRLITILLMCLFFGIGFIWMFISSIYNIGKNDGAQMQIEHITQPELPKQNDSINPLKFNYDEQRSTDDGK